jgi:peptidoglycan-N-acetylglucosamine deacetylase
VDSLALYLSLYGKEAGPSGPQLARLTYELGVTRFLELFAELDVRATFFVVGEDLLNEGVRAVAKDVHREGHAFGNHTWSHPYDLIRLPEEEARQEVLQCHHAVRKLTRNRPRVFRAPGYNMAPREYALLDELGYLYDASPLPSYPYLAVKYAVKSAVAMTGRTSRSIWGTPANFLGGREPYRLGNLWVLPNAVTPYLRLPVIGTTLATAPRVVVNHMLASMRKLDFVALEFHAVDLMELAGDRLPQALTSQKDLHVSVKSKQERYKHFLSVLLERMELFSPEVS